MTTNHITGCPVCQHVEVFLTLSCSPWLCQGWERRLVGQGLRGGVQEQHAHQLSVLPHDQLRRAHGHLQERGEDTHTRTHTHTHTHAQMHRQAHIYTHYTHTHTHSDTRMHVCVCVCPCVSVCVCLCARAHIRRTQSTGVALHAWCCFSGNKKTFEQLTKLTNAHKQISHTHK